MVIKKIEIKKYITDLSDSLGDFSGLEFLKIDGPAEVIPYYCLGNSTVKTVILGSNITLIEGEAFYGCNELDKLYVPKSVVSFDPYNEGDDISTVHHSSYIFEYTYLLKTAGPAGGGYNYEYEWDTEIPAKAFSSCDHLTSVTFPEGLKVIGNSAFEDTDRLAIVNIPESVESIEAFAFINSGLEQITFNSVNPPVFGNNEIFEYCNSLYAIFVPVDSVDKYKADPNLSHLASIIYPIGTHVEKPAPGPDGGEN